MFAATADSSVNFDLYTHSALHFHLLIISVVTIIVFLFCCCSFTNHISESANDLSATLEADDKAVTNQMYSEWFGDWLHFRPKTPDDELDVYGNFGEDFPQFAENASLSVDIQRITDADAATSQSNALPSTSDANEKYSPKLIFDQSNDNTFRANPFSYEYLRANAPKVDTYPFDSTTSPRYDDESSADELNLSGDSLPGGLTLSLGDNEANDKAIDTLLEECNGKLQFMAFFNQTISINSIA